MKRLLRRLIIILGIFSKRASAIPVIAGMSAGLLFTGSYILGTVYWGWEPWCFGIRAQGIGAIGILVNFAVALGLMPLVPRPSERAIQLIDSARQPEGAGPGVPIDDAPEH